MENASKALLIAGSILIVILIIAMGVRIFTSTTGTTDATEITMKTTEVSMFNNKFAAYQGSNKTRAQVMALVNVAIANNATDGVHQVTINGAVPTSYVPAASGFFTIRLNYDSNTGYVNNISITQ